MVAAWLLLFLVVSGEAVTVARNIDESTRGNNQRKFRGSGKRKQAEESSSVVDLKVDFKEDISSHQLRSQKSVVKDAILMESASLHTASTSVGDIITDVDHSAVHAQVKSLPTKSNVPEAIPESTSVSEAIPGAIPGVIPGATPEDDQVLCTSWTIATNERNIYDIIFRQSHETTNVTDGSMPSFVSMVAATNGAVDAKLTKAENKWESNLLDEMPPAFAELTVEMEVEPLCTKKSKGTTVLRVFLRRPSVYCDHTRVFNEDRCDRDGKTDGVWLALLTKASRIPFFVERASNGAVMSVKLASVDEQDLGVSELKRTIAQLLDVPDRCRPRLRQSVRQSFETLSNGAQAVTQYSYDNSPLQRHAGKHDKKESEQKVLHSTVLAPTDASVTADSDQTLRIVASTRDALLQYNLAHQFPEQYVTRRDPSKHANAKRRAVIRSLVTLQLNDEEMSKQTPDDDASSNNVPKCTLAMFGALHRKGGSLFLEMEDSLKLEAQVGMANYEKELQDIVNGVGHKHPPKKHEHPERFNPTDLASFRASHSARETSRGIDRFKDNAMALVDESSAEPLVNLDTGLTKGEIFAETVEQFVMLVPAMKATYNKIKKFQQKFFNFQNIAANLDNVMYDEQEDENENGFRAYKADSELDDWGVGCFTDFVSYMDRPPANYSGNAEWKSNAKEYMKLSRGSAVENDMILQDPLPSGTDNLADPDAEQLQNQIQDMPDFAPVVEFIQAEQLANCRYLHLICSLMTLIRKAVFRCWFSCLEYSLTSIYHASFFYFSVFFCFFSPSPYPKKPLHRAHS